MLFLINHEKWIEGKLMNSNLIIERKTIKAMVHIYCDHQHTNATNRLIDRERSNDLCNDCDTFLTYSYNRLKNCPSRENKPNCKACSIHCYNNDMRIYARKVMRHSGKYMVYKRPVLTIRYLLNKIKN